MVIIAISSIGSVFATEKAAIFLDLGYSNPVYNGETTVVAKVANVGNATAKLLDFQLIDVDDAFDFKIREQNSIRLIGINENFYVYYDLSAKRLGNHKLYYDVVWEDENGNRIETSTKDQPITLNVKGLPPEPPPLVPTYAILIIIGVIVVGFGLLYYMLQSKKHQIAK